MTTESSFGKMIYKARIAKGYNITQLANVSGVSHSTISLAEKDLGKPSFDSVYKIAVALDLDPKELINAAPHLDLSKAPPTALVFGKPDDLQIIFARRLRELRISRKKTQLEMKEAIRIAESRYGDMERGFIMPNERTLRELAHVLETTKEYLLGETDDPEPPL